MAHPEPRGKTSTPPPQSDQAVKVRASLHPRGHCPGVHGAVDTLDVMAGVEALDEGGGDAGTDGVMAFDQDIDLQQPGGKTRVQQVPLGRF